jgi:cobyrinic acid a,c-diamide synthase
LRIGILRDSAFQFYYPENLEALAGAGAELVYLSPLRDRNLPDLDALYLGGGFPETHVEALSRNVSFRDDIRRLADEGLPIYAECGGLMYLGESLILKGKPHPMVGVLPVEFGLSRRPRGHGYTVLTVERENPFYPVGSEIRGHEFHYSYVVQWKGEADDLVFTMKRGTGFFSRRDGLRYRNVLAMYTHVHALGTPEWAPALVRRAAAYREKMEPGRQ